MSARYVVGCIFAAATWQFVNRAPFLLNTIAVKVSFCVNADFQKTQPRDSDEAWLSLCSDGLSNELQRIFGCIQRPYPRNFMGTFDRQ